MRRLKEIIVVGALMLAAWSAFSLPAGMTSDQALTFGIMLITLSLWGTGLVPGYVASTFLFTALILAGLAAPQEVFSSFSSSAIWLVVTGFVIGAAITHSGLGGRLGAMARPHLSKSYATLIAGLMLIGMVLGFVMPSSLGRAAVLVPVGMALADVLGLGKGSTGRTGVAVIIAIGTNMPSFAILPSNIPNVILSGVAEQSFDAHFSYAEYLLLHYPVLGLLKSAIIVALVLGFFPARVATGNAIPTQTTGSGRRQMALLAILLVTLGFWSTDQIHGINAAWIGLGTSLVLMVPQLGFVPPPMFKSSVDFSMLLFVAGALTLGTVVNTSGLGEIIAGKVLSALPFQPGNDFLNFISLSLLGTGTSIFTTMAGVPAVLTPLAPNLAETTGFSLNAVLMMQVIGFSTVIFPYQVGPLIVAMGLAGESTRPLLKVTLALFVITFLVLLPLDFLWWKLLGVI
ncbi:transporter, divalent anion:Na+ symporter (DASS) family [Thalassovita gelatinovora]|uniref:Transporter, divalent anion:Na+ symporter (DASS) family n=1 Tax=Thalassovita gelatinovora TaxID=53501 RepID=A0A0P1FGL0_THAGE|nr:SLC13 family permease [Thalassovita gelatinovora]QIZ81882.1 SLC13 family permease [Thalassovita gelatinovora]CUH67211.1 transporter, divalent anion:Na+ symporter (DASS) family [Thalassovita gelatinovora]SEP78336.1 Di-and tricarboxylate transporter [Thalassovita gelatinovora]